MINGIYKLLNILEDHLENYKSHENSNDDNVYYAFFHVTQEYNRLIHDRLSELESNNDDEKYTKDIEDIEEKLKGFMIQYGEIMNPNNMENKK